MKSSTRELVVLASVGMLPAVILLVIGVVAYFSEPPPTYIDPDPELRYLFPFILSAMWTFFIFLVVAAIIAVRINRNK